MTSQILIRYLGFSFDAIHAIGLGFIKFQTAEYAVCGLQIMDGYVEAGIYC